MIQRRFNSRIVATGLGDVRLTSSPVLCRGIARLVAQKQLSAAQGKKYCSTLKGTVGNYVRRGIGAPPVIPGCTPYAQAQGFCTVDPSSGFGGGGSTFADFLNSGTTTPALPPPSAPPNTGGSLTKFLQGELIPGSGIKVWHGLAAVGSLTLIAAAKGRR